MKKELSPVDSSKKSRTDNKLLRAFGSSSKPIEVVTKMKITERSMFPTKGLPRTLKELNINDIGCARMPIGILNLTNLTILDLSNNCITQLHKSLGNLKISKLVLNKNNLGESILAKDWEWLTGETLKRSLTFLNISNNKLKFISSNVFKCFELAHLDISFNEIARIPFAIGQMKRLKILNINNNSLESLPYTIIKPRFDLVDLSSNRLPSQEKAVRIIKQSLSESNFRPEHKRPSLLELCARTIIKQQIPFRDLLIPTILKEILVHSPICANCEVLCFEAEIFKNINLIQLNTKQRVTSDNADSFPADGPFCSGRCILNVSRRLFPNQ